MVINVYINYYEIGKSFMGWQPSLQKATPTMLSMMTSSGSILFQCTYEIGM